MPGVGSEQDRSVDGGGPGTSAGFQATASWTVPELTGAVQAVLDRAFATELWVEGEIAGLRRRAGPVYFELVEPGPSGAPPLATLHVVLFEAARHQVNRALRSVGGVRMADGMRVRIRGRLQLYPRSGRLQLRMSGIDPTYTIGLLASARERVLRTLAAEGLLEANARLPLPAVPLHLGLVTAPGSAAFADVRHELESSGFAWRVRLVPTRVQGTGAEAELAEAVRLAASLGVDAVLLVRGGGARTDLAPFDGEVLARTIAGIDVPVITGIGHETDSTVADAVAHTACKTPTAAAAFVCGRVEAFLDLLDVRTRTVVASAHRAVTLAGQRTAACAGRLEGATRHQLRTAETQLTRAERSLGNLAMRAARDAERRIDTFAARVDALDPNRTLARGWSITRRGDGTVVRHVSDVAIGDRLVTVVADGMIHSRALELAPGATVPDREGRDAQR